MVRTENTDSKQGLNFAISPEILNTHFTDVCGIPISAHPTESSDLDPFGNSGYSDGKFYLTYLTHDELILSTLTSKSVGDGLKIEKIKRAMPVIAFYVYSLSPLYTKSMPYGSVLSFGPSPK